MVARSFDPKRGATTMAQAVRREYLPDEQMRLDGKASQAIAQFEGVGTLEDRHRQDLAVKHLQELIGANQYHDAGQLIDQLLTENPESIPVQYLLCRLMIETDKSAVARPTALQIVANAPDRAEGWLLLGAIEAALQRPDKALAPLQRAISLKPEWADPYRVLSTAYTMLYQFEDAERAAIKALSYGDHHIPHSALAFVALHKRDWAKGWKEYENQMGRVPGRDVLDYGLPTWKGEGTVLVYGEQGLGDQLAYCSALTDQCTQLVTHPKLANLIRRSVKAEVHGDQFVKTRDWELTAQHQASMSMAMQYQAMKPRGRWLKPHPEKSSQWRALMYEKAKVKDRPWVGIAWTGGKVGTHGWKGRNISHEDMKPILELPANFVSLEYRANQAPNGVHDWPWATQTADLDDCAALVDNCDAVVCVPSTIYHLAGSLGIPCHVIVHDRPHFHEGTSGPSPWWESVKFYRRSEMSTAECVALIAKELERVL